MRRRRRLAFVLLVALTAAAPLRATGPARLVLDPDPGTRVVPKGASDFAQLGDRAVFVRIDPGLGRALWVTDGTPAGTAQLGLLCPPCGYTILLGSTGRVAFYRVGDGFNSYDPGRWRLWRTDGTAAGTFALTSELRFPWGLPIPLDLPFRAALEGDRLYFTGCLPTTGCELWSSDGTIPGTGPLAEIAPGPPSANVVELTAAAGQAFALTREEDGSRSLWIVDPSRAARLVGALGQARSLISTGARAYFVAGGQVWASDATALGTGPVATFVVNDVGPLTAIDGQVYVAADDGKYGPELWRVTAGLPPRRLTNFRAKYVTMYPPRRVGNRLVFVARVGFGGDTLWSTDETAAAPSVTCPGACLSVAYTRGYRASDSPLAPVEGALAPVAGGRVAFYGGAGGRVGLWVSDGTSDGTRLLTDRAPGGFVQYAAGGGRALFQLTSEYELGEFWVTDGTERGTFRVAAPGGPYWSHYSGWSDIVHAGAAGGGRFVFGAPLEPDDEVLHDVPWSSDGTPAGTVPLLGKRAARSSQPRSLVALRGGVLVQDSVDDKDELRFVRRGEAVRLLPDCPSLDPPVVAGDLAFFLCFGAYPQLWRTDGTPAGTRLLLADAGSSAPSNIAPFGDKVALAIDTDFVWELWTSDGSAAGTRRLLALPLDGRPQALTAIGDRFYFFDGGGSFESWRPWASDGTPEGTRPLIGAVAPAGPDVAFDQLRFVELDGRVFFVAAEGAGPLEVWSSDGTPAGTTRAVTAASGMAGPKTLQAIGGRLYLAASRAGDVSGPLRPWASDGTDGGTVLLAPLALTTDRLTELVPFYGPLPFFVALGDRVFFAAADARHGLELWGTDGTPTGTALVRDIARGPVNGYPQGLIAWRGRLWLAARDRTTGMELWTSDGTAAGTMRVDDIAAGAAWSFPQELTASDDGLYFTAQDAAHGRELWRLHAAGVP